MLLLVLLPGVDRLTEGGVAAVTERVKGSDE